MVRSEGSFETLQWEVKDGVATVTLNRPEALHALNAAMFDELDSVFREFAADDAIRVVLLTGSGERAFAAGADIRELAPTDAESGRALSTRGQAVFRQIERCGKPVIACINGVALGGGLELAMACSFRIASERARLGLPELRLGLIPGYGGTQRTVKLIGRGPALRLMLVGEPVDAAEALRLGLVQEVVPPAELMPHAREIAAKIAAMAPLAVRGLLQAVDGAGVGTADAAFQMETEIFGRLCGTADKHEGLTAFLEKRPAVWQGW